jgi:hypothetical protein
MFYDALRNKGKSNFATERKAKCDNPRLQSGRVVLISQLANGIQLKGKCDNAPISRLANGIQ